MITLPFALGGRLRDAITAYYRKYKIEEPDEVKALSVYRKRDTFLESEFEHITEIHVDNEMLNYIDLFPNVNKIHFDMHCNLSQYDIQSIIDKYPNIVELSIIEQPNVQIVNIRGLTKLQELKIVGNKNLRKVSGIDCLEDIYKLVFYGNIMYSHYEELCASGIKYATEGSQIDLDVLAFPEMIKVVQDDEELRNLPEHIFYNIKWNEAVGLKKLDSHLRYSSSQMMVVYKKALEICQKYLNEKDSEVYKYAILYQWMCENVKYDHNGLTKGNSLVVDGLRLGEKGGANGTVNALLYRNCVCQGYSKGLQFLTKMAGLHSYDVDCIVDQAHQNIPFIVVNNERTKHNGDHSIQKVILDGRIYYSDATWDAGRFQRGDKPVYFLLSKKDISTTHKLVGEDSVTISHSSYLPEEQNIILKCASDRIKQIDREFKIQKEIEELRRSRENNEYSGKRM